jgi:hypothetical protein
MERSVAKRRWSSLYSICNLFRPQETEGAGNARAVGKLRLQIHLRRSDLVTMHKPRKFFAMRAKAITTDIIDFGSQAGTTSMRKGVELQRS